MQILRVSQPNFMEAFDGTEAEKQPRRLECGNSDSGRSYSRCPFPHAVHSRVYGRDCRLHLANQTGVSKFTDQPSSPEKGDRRRLQTSDLLLV